MSPSSISGSARLGTNGHGPPTPPGTGDLDPAGADRAGWDLAGPDAPTTEPHVAGSYRHRDPLDDRSGRRRALRDATDDGTGDPAGPRHRWRGWSWLRDLPVRRRLTLHSLVILSIALGVSITVGLATAGQLIEQAEQTELQRLSDALASELDNDAYRAATLATGLSTTTAVAEAFADRDRERLEALVLPGFAQLQSELGIAQVHFHEPPATSFFRAHEPEAFGDDLSGFRQTVVAANREQTLITGLETGRFGLGLRAVVPVRWEDAHVGTVEVGTSFGAAFFERFAAANDAAVAFYLADGGDGFGGVGFTTYASTVGEAPTLDTATLAEVLRGTTHHAGFTAAGTSLTARYEAVTDFAGAPIGVVMVAVPDEALRAIYRSDRLTLLGLAVLLLVAGAVAAWWFARDLSRPLEATREVLRRARAGDLSSRVTIERNDEVGAIGHDVNATLTRLGQLMHDVADNAETLAAAADEMSAVGQQLETNAADTADRAVLATEAAHAVSGSIGSIASASHQLSGAIEEIARNANDATGVARRGVAVTDETVAAMEQLGESSAEIDTIVSLISEIAGQTHLLALNANIEAARAGDAGRAFAVVANEIGTLARRTAVESETISERIRSIRTATATSVTAMTAVSETMGEISELQVSIASAVEEQAATTAEIGRSVAVAADTSAEIASAMSSVSEGTGETRQAAGDTARAARELHTVAGQLQGSVAYYLDD